jgi:putative transposase
VIEVDTSLRSARLVRVFECLKETRGLPDIASYFHMYYGPEFLGEVFVNWCEANGIGIDYIERFKRILRNELLYLYLFRNPQQLRELTGRWRKQYNEHRPHDALGGIPPAVYAQRLPQNSNIELST